MIITIPNLKLVSEANRQQHWAARGKRAKAQRELASYYVRPYRDAIPIPATITIRRIAPRALDDDNLARACKAVRDGIADALLPATQGNQRRRWANDSDGQIAWRYEQRKGRPKEHGVEIEVSE